MTDATNKHLELQIFYTAIGKLPKIGGCYFSNRQSTTFRKSPEEKLKNRSTNDRDLERARKRLDFQLKKNGYKTKKKQLQHKSKTEVSEIVHHQEKIEIKQGEKEFSDEAVKKCSQRLPPNSKMRFPTYLIRLRKPDRNRESFLHGSPIKQNEISHPLPKGFHSHQIKRKIKVNDLDIQRLQNSNYQSSQYKTQEPDLNEHLDPKSQRQQFETQNSRRHSLLVQKISERRDIATKIPVSQLMPKINQTILFKRYHQIQHQQRQPRSRTQHFKEQLKQYL